MNQPTQAITEYLEAVINRSRVSMVPAGFEPDWADKPWPWKHYPRAEVLE